MRKVEEIRRMFASLVTDDPLMQRRLLDPTQRVPMKVSTLAGLLARALDLWIQMHQRRRDPNALQKLQRKFARAEDDFIGGFITENPSADRRRVLTAFSILCDKVTDQLGVSTAELKDFLEAQAGQGRALAG